VPKIGVSSIIKDEPDNYFQCLNNSNKKRRRINDSLVFRFIMIDGMFV